MTLTLTDITAPIDPSDLAEHARSNPAAFRAALAGLSAEQLVQQATAYAAYAERVTGPPVDVEETLKRFQCSVAATKPVSTAPAYRKEIAYDRETHDYAMFLDGELVGFARSYHQAEIDLDTLVFELMSGQYFREAA